MNAKYPSPNMSLSKTKIELDACPTIKEENEQDKKVENLKVKVERRRTISGSSIPTSSRTVVYQTATQKTLTSQQALLPRTSSLRGSQKKKPTHLSREEYNMNSIKRGTVVIFNHRSFSEESNQKERRGTEMDVANLEKTLPKLGFNVDDIIVHHELTKKRIMQELDNLSKKDHTSSDCFVLFVLTHGEKKDKIRAQDTNYDIKKLWEFFTADNCPSLAGKPKLFFIIACRGDDFEFGTTVTDAGPTNKNSSTYTIPNSADILVVYSSQPDKVSLREVDLGTWYIQALCNEIKKLKLETEDLMDLLTRVNRRVAISYQHPNLRIKQCPSINSMLLFKVYFRKKANFS